MTATVEHFEADSVTISIPVTDEASGAPKDMAGGSVAAFAKSKEGGATLPLTAGISTTSVTVDIAPWLLTAGFWAIQARVTIGSDVQTVAHFDLRSKNSLA